MKRYVAEIPGFWAGPYQTCRQSAVVDLTQEEVTHPRHGRGYVLAVERAGDQQTETVVYPVPQEPTRSAG